MKSLPGRSAILLAALFVAGCTTLDFGKACIDAGGRAGKRGANPARTISGAAGV